jgi:alkanesulfonate monooxygenase SsuD/methylene tetrahydromethanopterin reductase-like flavin-dependent oxidoreductase (luciferase family)
MRFDLLYTFDNPDYKRPWADVLAHGREHVELADELDYGGIFLGEHHFDIEGIDQIPNPLMLGADFAARTSRIRIAIGAVSLPLWHPLRVAEDLAMLDQFSSGRLDISLGRGIIQRDIMNLNPAADRRKDEQSRAIFLEHLAIVRKLWTEEPFSWESELYRFPHPGIKSPVSGGPPDPRYATEDGEVIALGLVPPPVQRPHPPLYTVSEAAAGFVMAAEQDLLPITWLPIGRHYRDLLEAYCDARERRTGVRPPLGEDTAALRLCFVAESDAEARRIAEPAVERLFALMTRIRGRKVWLDDGEDETEPAIADAKPFDLLLERGHLFVGGPQSVAELIQNSVDTFGVQHWLLQMTLPDIVPERVRDSIRLFSDAVIPRVHGAGVAAT